MWGGGESNSQDGSTALMRAVDDGHAECVRLLIDAGADKDAMNMVRVSRCSLSFHICFLFCTLTLILYSNFSKSCDFCFVYEFFRFSIFFCH
jgi:hypothetical protein